MISIDEFRKNNEPAFDESEREYFLRLSAEFNQLKKIEARQLRKQLWISRLTAVTRVLVTGPNLLRTKPA